MGAFTYNINQPLYLNKIGQRPNNEDAIYPKNGGTVNDRLFLVCDGVGGANKGEVASNLICDYLPQFFEDIDFANENISEGKMFSSVRHVEGLIKEYLKDHPECKGMSSTLTVACFHKSGCSLLWVGDSRIYQFRNNEVIYKTKDHSLVNILIKEGKITEAEAINHPQKNVILEAINGKRAANPSYEKIDDIKNGDVFLLCSDGVVDVLTDKELVHILFQENKNYKLGVEKIDDILSRKSADNYSLYLIEVENVVDKDNETQTIIHNVPTSNNQEDSMTDDQNIEISNHQIPSENTTPIKKDESITGEVLPKINSASEVQNALDDDRPLQSELSEKIADKKAKNKQRAVAFLVLIILVIIILIMKNLN